ncbi:MAG: IPT/TIG domain-containing protein, partial [Methanoregula sp.]|uniref:IPT/TIG domain-containing protein n=1 Tax=Methanoregula sp. TaxID=2052170 RepID=UPI003D12DF4E
MIRTEPVSALLIEIPAKQVRPKIRFFWTCFFFLFLLLVPAVSAQAITGISPPNGTILGGTSVSIAGSAFTGVTAVKFGSTPATSYTFNNDTSITAIAPAGTGTIDITVITPGGTSATSAADRFTYVRPAQPVVTGISPTTGTKLGGTIVSISGSGFTGV